MTELHFILAHVGFFFLVQLTRVSRVFFLLLRMVLKKTTNLKAPKPWDHFFVIALDGGVLRWGGGLGGVRGGTAGRGASAGHVSRPALHTPQRHRGLKCK